jgi:predicted thioesterase
MVNHLCEKEIPMTETLQPGLTGTASVTVTADLTAAVLGSGNVDVYSTPALIALLEAAAISALAGHLADGQTSVGTALDVRHLAATPVGMNVILSQGIRLGKTNAVVGGDALRPHLSPSY